MATFDYLQNLPANQVWHWLINVLIIVKKHQGI